MEVHLAGSDNVKWTQVRVPSLSASLPHPPHYRNGDDGYYDGDDNHQQNVLLSPSTDLAGTCSLGSPSFRHILWRIHKSSPSSLELFELDDCEAQIAGLRLSFEEPLSPFISIYLEQVPSGYEEERLCACVITISGAVYVLKIKTFYKYRNMSFFARSQMVQFSLAGDLAQLDQVTSFAALGGSICVGGKSGSVLCYCLERVSGSSQDYSYELKDSEPLLGRLWGFVGRVKNSAPLRSLNMQKHKESLMLFALHEDGTFKLWDLSDRSRLLSFNLQKDLMDCFPKKMWVQEQGLRSGLCRLAFHFENKEAPGQGTIQIYELQFTLMDGAASLTFILQLPSVEGTVLDLKFLTDSFWKLEEADGHFNLTHHSLDSDELLENCVLLEAEVEEQLFQKSTDNWEDLILFQQSTIPGSKTEFQIPISELFLSRIMQSRICQRDVLCEVLQKYRRISETDFFTLSKDGLRKEILSIVEADNTGNDKLDHLMAWKAFCTDYFTAWKQRNKPYSLLVDGYTGNIAIIRHHSLSIRRSLSEFEKNYARNGYNNTENDFWGVLSQCISSISKQLGRLPLSAFGQTLLGNRPSSLSHVCSVFLHLLDVGYDSSILMTAAQYGVDTGRKKKHEYQRAHRKFQLQMIFDLCELRDSVGNWEKALENMETCMNQLMQDTRVSAARIAFEGLEYGIMSRRLVLESTIQLSWAHFEAARDILLLLTYILSVQGQVGMSTSNAATVQLKLILPIKKILLLSLLVHWLSVTSAEIAPPEDYSLHLSTLQLDSVAPEKPSSKYTGAAETTLAEILMSASSASALKGMFLKSKGLISSDELMLTTKAFIGWIMWGESPELMQTVSTHAVSLAAKFLEHGQYAHLQKFLRIVDDLYNETEAHNTPKLQSDWCARLHLLGCGLLGQARTNDKSGIENRVEEAVQCFFRVASAVGKGGDDLHTFLLKIGMQSSFPSGESTASWTFQYFEWVMEIFEQHSVNEGACQFAYAALQEVDEMERSFRQETPERSYAIPVIKGRLWSNIFKFSLDQKNFIEAYCAIISNPDLESKYICLRRFLIVICEQKATEVLCGSELPYTGMLERVEQELVLKANYSDVTANPNPFKLLYAFHMQRNNWRRAALYMYLYSVRMKETGQVQTRSSSTFLLQERLNGLAAAINALHLVEPTSAWLDLESDICGNLSCRPSKRIRIYANINAAHTGQGSVDLEELEKEYTLTSAQLLLVENDVQMGGEASPSSVLSMLVQSDLYEMAFTMLFHFWKSSSFQCKLEKIFRIMAERWCLRQQENRGTVETDRKLLLLPPPEPRNGTDKLDRLSEATTNETMSNNVCNALQGYLSKYTKFHPRLPIIVAETMLNIDRLVELPVWLVDMLKGGRQAGVEGMSLPSADPGALLRIYLDYGRVSEAAILFMEFVKAWTNLPPSHVVKRKRMCSVWFPYTLVDRLKAALSELKRSEQFVSLHNLLDNTLQKHFNQVKTDSIDMKSLVQC